VIAAHQTMLAPPALPYDAEVEYLESTGTQYIDTGIAPVFPSNLEYRARIRWTNTTNRQIMGLQGGMYVGVVNGKYQPGYGGNTTVSAPVLAGVACDVGAKFYLTTPDVNHLSRVDWALDSSAGTIYTQLYYYKPAGSTVWLFVANDATTLRGSSAIYSFQILVNGILVRDFQPVRVGSGSSAVGYLYDRVSGTLFGNAGTGAFPIGPDKT